LTPAGSIGIEEIKCRNELYQVARLTGDDPTRRLELCEAHRLFTEIGAPIRAAEVAKELGLATAS
jgi:hypothetical protein